jgi:uncharacterized protein
MQLQPFHIAIPVNDLLAARRFYIDLLGCSEGRSSKDWVDFNMYGHQVVCHSVNAIAASSLSKNAVEGEEVPIPHFGVVLLWHDWEALARRLSALNATFTLKPDVRFVDQPGEQATFFITDPAGNVLEFKALRTPENLFASNKDDH